MSTLMIRNIIMYSVVSAVLVVAAVRHLQHHLDRRDGKQRDIAILKSMGFHARDIEWIFVTQGCVLGLAGCAIGLPLGMAMMGALHGAFVQGSGKLGPDQHSDGLELVSVRHRRFLCVRRRELLAALLPARKAAYVQPVDILRGGT